MRPFVILWTNHRNVHISPDICHVQMTDNNSAVHDHIWQCDNLSKNKTRYTYAKHELILNYSLYFIQCKAQSIMNQELKNYRQQPYSAITDIIFY